MAFLLTRVIGCDHPGCTSYFTCKARSEGDAERLARDDGWTIDLGEYDPGDHITPSTKHFCQQHSGKSGT